MHILHAQAPTRKRQYKTAKGVQGCHTNRIRVIPADGTVTWKGKPRKVRRVRSSEEKLIAYHKKVKTAIFEKSR
jgi:hypothetical protein